MTRKLTRERIEWLNYAATGLAANGTEMAMSPQDVIALTECCLAALDSEPVAFINGAWTLVYYRPPKVSGLKIGDRLYRHAQQPVVPDERAAFNAWNNEDNLPIAGVGAKNAAWLAWQARAKMAGNSPVIPDGYVMVPMRLTAENGAKGVLSGEFSETKFVNCPECFGDDECETCDGSGRIELKVPVSWTTIKDIWIKGVEHFAAAPQENI